MATEHQPISVSENKEDAEFDKKQTVAHESQKMSIDEYQWEQYKLLEPRLRAVNRMLADS